jgi:two-component system cell cycle sensor histidine kinase/response regulator CckA
MQGDVNYFVSGVPRMHKADERFESGAASGFGPALRPFLLAGVVAAALFWSFGAWPDEPALMLAAIAWGVSGACIGALSARRFSVRSAGRTEDAFHALFSDGAAPAALSDSRGYVRALNPAMRAATDHPAHLVADLFAQWTDSPDALVYRLASKIRRGESACEVVTSPAGGHMICARRIAAGRLIWTVDAVAPEMASPSAAHEAGFASDAFIETLPVALARLSLTGEIIFANAAARTLLGQAAAPGAAIGALIEGLGRSMETRVAEAVRGDGSGRAEIARGEPDGNEVFLQVSLTRVVMDGTASLVAVMADATELKTLEAQFVQSQKMQAVGQLAGGVAHDFNNLLTAIAGHTDLLMQRHDNGDTDYADLNQIRQNANRAAGLVRQLLAFSRKQTLRPSIVNLTDALTEISHLLNRLLGEKTTLRIENADNLHLVKVDERQFEQVVMNLVVNARDAMTEGGTVIIRTSNARVAAEQRRGRAVMPRGDYVRIDVIDSGVGIPADKIDQIFEPFYTTKRVGEGTGLGLSTVYGIIKQTGGFIFADSIVGRGTTFSIYLPRNDATDVAVAAPVKAVAADDDLTGRGVVLLIEDEAPVRAFAARALKLRGYEVLEAASAEEALDLLADPALQVDVLVSDVVMPGMDGPTCVREARKQRPDVRVVFVSGYAEDSLKRAMQGLDNCHFLPKPFSLNELTAKVKECVNA